MREYTRYSAKPKKELALICNVEEPAQEVQEAFFILDFSIPMISELLCGNQPKLFEH